MLCIPHVVDPYSSGRLEQMAGHPYIWVYGHCLGTKFFSVSSMKKNVHWHGCSLGTYLQNYIYFLNWEKTKINAMRLVDCMT